MAKDYKKADEWQFNYDTASNWTTPTWVQVPSFNDLAILPQRGDVEVPEQNQDTGHLQGVGDPQFTWTQMHDAGDANVNTLIINSLSGAMTHIAFSLGSISANNTEYYHMECMMTQGGNMTRGDVTSYDFVAMRHANSDNTFERVFTP